MSAARRRRSIMDSTDPHPPPTGSAPPPPGAGELLIELAGLTGGLAHEIRNPLSTLKVNLQLLDEDWKKIDEPDRPQHSDPQVVARRSRARIATLLRETDRLERILEDFLRFVARPALRLASCDLNEVVRDLVEFFRPQAESSRIDLSVTYFGGPLVCRVDVNAMKQAILNLLINAQQAMAGGGALTLRLGKTPSGEARLDVSDSGPGIPPEHRAKIFDAYYSTKKGGTGLGLATTRRIVQEHGGRLEVESPPGGGATLSIVLPAAG